MGLIRLAKRSRDRLMRVARSRSNTRHAKRAKALLGLHHGKSVQQVADETGLSRQAVYNLQKRFLERRDQRDARTRAGCPAHRPAAQEAAHGDPRHQ